MRRVAPVEMGYSRQKIFPAFKKQSNHEKQSKDMGKFLVNDMLDPPLSYDHTHALSFFACF